MNSMDARGSALSDSYLSIIDAECDSLCKELEGKHCVCSNKVDMPRLWQTNSVLYLFLFIYSDVPRSDWSAWWEQIRLDYRFWISIPPHQDKPVPLTLQAGEDACHSLKI